MTRKERTWILVHTDAKILKMMAEQIEDITIIEKPRNSLVMVRMRETAQNSIFYIGEVFVTECKVRIGNSIGTGIIRGNEPDKAYWLSVIDAAYNSCADIISEWDDILHVEKNYIMDTQRKHNAAIMKTKVNFETMNLEV